MAQPQMQNYSQQQQQQDEENEIIEQLSIINQQLEEEKYLLKMDNDRLVAKMNQMAKQVGAPPSDDLARQVQELMRDKESTHETMVSLQKQNEALQKQLKSQPADVEALTLLNELSEEYAHLSERAEKTTQKLKDALKENELLKSHLQDNQSNSSSSQTQLIQLSDELKSVSREREDLNSEMTRIKATTQGQLNEMTQRMENLLTDNSNIRQSYESLQRSSSENEKMLLNQVESLTGENAKLSQLHSNLASNSSSQYQEMSQELMKMIEENEKLRKEVSNASMAAQRNMRAQDELEQVAFEKETLNHKLDALELEYTKAQESFSFKMQSVVRENEDLKATLETLQSASGGHVDRLGKELDKVTSERDNLGQQLRYIQKDLAETTQSMSLKLQSLHEENEALKSRIEAQQSAGNDQADKLTMELQKVLQHNHAIRQDLDSAQKQLIAKNQDIINTQATGNEQSGKLKVEIQKLMQQNQAIRQDLESAHKQLIEKNQEVMNMQVKMSEPDPTSNTMLQQLSQEKSSLVEENKKLWNVIERQKDTIHRLEKKFKEREKEMDRPRSSSRRDRGENSPSPLDRDFDFGDKDVLSADNTFQSVPKDGKKKSKKGKSVTWAANLVIAVEPQKFDSSDEDVTSEVASEPLTSRKANRQSEGPPDISAIPRRRPMSTINAASASAEDNVTKDRSLKTMSIIGEDENVNPEMGGQGNVKVAMRQLGGNKGGNARKSVGRFSMRTNSLMFVNGKPRLSQMPPSKEGSETSPTELTTSPVSETASIESAGSGTNPSIPPRGRSVGAASKLGMKPNSSSPVLKPSLEQSQSDLNDDTSSVLSSSTNALDLSSDNGDSLLRDVTSLQEMAISIPASTLSAQKKGETFLFQIRVESNSACMSEINRLYSDFLTLDKRLRQSLSKEEAGQLPKLPDKSLFTGHSPSKGDIRKSHLEQYLNGVKSVIPENEILIRFLSSSTISPDPWKDRRGMKGYLAKRGKSFGNWKCRFFVLERTSLLYYDHEDGPYCGKIPLGNCSVQAQEYDPDNDFLHGFVIADARRMNGSMHILCADNDKARDEWIEAIKQQQEVASDNGDDASVQGDTSSVANEDNESDSSLSSTLDAQKEESREDRKQRFNIGGWVKRKQERVQSTYFSNDQGRKAPMFGTSLSDVVSAGKYKPELDIPTVVLRCVEFLDANQACQEEGIYRLSGSSKLIQQLRDRFDRDGDMDLISEATGDSGDDTSSEFQSIYDVHVIAGLLKLYFRLLPHPLLSKELHPLFLEAAENPDKSKRIQLVASLFTQLPRCNFTLLRYLSAHLLRIVQNQKQNRMTLRNVGIVFSPTLGIPASILTMMLQDFETVFNNPGDNDMSSS
jgi:chromosome segregation ATPase